jgi:hypothetical protein
MVEVISILFQAHYWILFKLLMAILPPPVRQAGGGAKGLTATFILNPILGTRLK